MSSSLLLPNEVSRASESLSLQVAEHHVPVVMTRDCGIGAHARAIRIEWAERTVRGFVFFHRA